MTSILDTRPSPIAGQWYPADASQLAAEVDSYINAAQLLEAAKAGRSRSEVSMIDGQLQMFGGVGDAYLLAETEGSKDGVVSSIKLYLGQ